MSSRTRYITKPDPVIVLDLKQDDRLYQGIFEETSKKGYAILNLKATNGAIPPGINIAGFLTMRPADSPWIIEKKEKGFNVVRLARYTGEFDKTLPTVFSDLEAAGKMAADYFAERLFKDLAFIGNYPWSQEPVLYNAFQEQCLNRNCNCHLLRVKTKKIATQKNFKYRMGQVLEWLHRLPKPVGIFSYNDFNISRTYTIAAINGFDVPGEIALLGLGNIKIECDFLPVPLSSIDLNLEEKGRVAVRLLSQLHHGATDQKTQIFIPPKGVVERQSTNLLAVSDPVVHHAISFIRDHYREQLSIDDIAKEAGVARSTLILKFNKHFDKGVNAELRRQRLQHAKLLLSETNMKISSIAPESGFPSPPYFYKAFLKEYGMTPGEFRESRR